MNHTRTTIAVPEEWMQAAEEMDVSDSEYIRRMVRAGRRQWGYEYTSEPEKKGLNHDDSRSQSGDLEDTFRAAVFQNLSKTEGLDEEELAELLFENLIDDLGAQLQQLKDSGKADYNPRDGGWVRE